MQKKRERERERDDVPFFFGVPWSGHAVNHQCITLVGLLPFCVIFSSVLVPPGKSVVETLSTPIPSNVSLLP